MPSDEKLDTMTDEELAATPDDELQLLAGSAILGAAVMNGSASADKYYARTGRVYAECARRSRGIYQRAYNSAVRGQGHYGMVAPVTEGCA